MVFELFFIAHRFSWL